MQRLKDMIHWQTTSGERFTIGGVSITPQAQALVLRGPFGGWVWNRPVAIVVEQGQQTKRMPIVDVTRRVQIGFMGLGLLFGLVSLIWMRQERRNKSE
jgi:hypothetical protein